MNNIRQKVVVILGWNLAINGGRRFTPISHVLVSFTLVKPSVDSLLLWNTLGKNSKCAVMSPPNRGRVCSDREENTSNSTTPDANLSLGYFITGKLGTSEHVVWCPAILRLFLRLKNRSSYASPAVTPGTQLLTWPGSKLVFIKS